METDWLPLMEGDCVRHVDWFVQHVSNIEPAGAVCRGYIGRKVLSSLKFIFEHLDTYYAFYSH